MRALYSDPMMDRFRVARSAEQMVKVWGPIEYTYPMKRGGEFKPGSRIGAIIDSPTGLRYGHMLFGLAHNPAKPQTPFVLDELCIEKQMYHPYFKNHRCLVPVDAWYFHTRERNKVKHFMIRSNQKTALAMGAVYHTAHNRKDGTRVTTCGLVSMRPRLDFNGFSQIPALFIAGENNAKNFLDVKRPWHWAYKEMDKFPFEIIEVIPCASDDGIAMPVEGIGL
jgi:putative SOS response-associated peptidase YedK